MTIKSTLLKSGEKISPVLLRLLKNINKNRKQSGAHEYFVALSEILPAPKKGIDEKHKRFLAGFILAEGSINCSAKKKSELRFGVALDPEFSVTQHLNRAGHLMALLKMFGTGRIYHKSGSNATLVYVIHNRQSIEEKCIPFWKRYIAPYESGIEGQRFRGFVQIVTALNKGAHKCRKTFLEQLLPLWDSLRKQQGQSNQSFSTLEQAKDWVITREVEESSPGEKNQSF